MSSEAMTLDQFVQLAQTWGGQIERWPQTQRDAAYALLDSDRNALAALIEAAELEHLITPIPDPTPALRTRILADAVSSRPATRGFLHRLWDELGGLRLIAPAFASSVLLAVALVQLDPSTSGVGEDHELFDLALLAVEDEEYLP